MKHPSQRRAREREREDGEMKRGLDTWAITILYDRAESNGSSNQSFHPHTVPRRKLVE